MKHRRAGAWHGGAFYWCPSLGIRRRKSADFAANCAARVPRASCSVPTRKEPKKGDEKLGDTKRRRLRAKGFSGVRLAQNSAGREGRIGPCFRRSAKAAAAEAAASYYAFFPRNKAAAGAGAGTRELSRRDSSARSPACAPSFTASEGNPFAARPKAHRNAGPSGRKSAARTLLVLPLSLLLPFFVCRQPRPASCGPRRAAHVNGSSAPGGVAARTTKHGA